MISNMDSFLHKVDLRQSSNDLFDKLKIERPVLYNLYDQFRGKYSFELDPFQKYAIYGLLNGENVLVTVPTSCGKTIIAEYAIFECFNTNQSGADAKVIYTSPIKTLSNQKYFDFKEKFGANHVGIVTGDIKFNPDAPLVIMTTEILRDLVLKRDPMLLTVKSVVFDEVHYINNEERGYVWEECLMLLPTSVQLVMLSATIGNPDRFASWIGAIKQKRCHLIVHTVRPVALNHQLYYPDSASGTFFKSYYPSSKSHSVVSDVYENYYRSFDDKIRPNETSYLNHLVDELRNADRCPVLFFVFSRQGCEKYARALNITFHDVAKQAEVEHTVNWLLSKYQYSFQTLKLSNQISEIIDLAKRGVGYHHASLLPVSKEIVETLFSKQLIKVLFVTETFSVGINMPTRTVVFTDLKKNVKGIWRPLLTDEFYQMAGRAGRRGLDKEGYVIYAPIGRMLNPMEMSNMIDGAPASFDGRFSFEYQNLLQQLLCGQPFEIIQKAYLYVGLSAQVKQTNSKVNELRVEIDKITDELEVLKVSEREQELLSSYFKAQNEASDISNGQFIGNIKLNVDQKAKRDAIKRVDDIRQKLRDEGMYGKRAILSKFQKWLDFQKKLKELKNELSTSQLFIDDPERAHADDYQRVLDDLGLLKFIKDGSLTQKGILAARINNTDGLLMATLLESGIFNDMSIYQLGIALHILTGDLPRREDDETDATVSDDPMLRYFWKVLGQEQDSLAATLVKYKISNYSSCLANSTLLWMRGGSFHETVASITNLQGNFIRSMMRLLHLCEELIKCFTDLGKYLGLEVKIREIIKLINRDLVVFDSIYIK